MMSITKLFAALHVYICLFHLLFSKAEWQTIPGQSSKYQLFSDEISNDLAMERCSDLLSHLVYMETRQETNAIYSDISSGSSPYWIGLIRGSSSSNSQWRWSSSTSEPITGELMTYNKFPSGEEKQSDKDRTFVDQREWKTETKSASKAYMCEKEESKSTVSPTTTEPTTTEKTTVQHETSTAEETIPTQQLQTTTTQLDQTTTTQPLPTTTTQPSPTTTTQPLPTTTTQPLHTTTTQPLPTTTTQPLPTTTTQPLPTTTPQPLPATTTQPLTTTTTQPLHTTTTQPLRKTTIGIRPLTITTTVMTTVVLEITTKESTPTDITSTEHPTVTMSTTEKTDETTTNVSMEISSAPTELNTHNYTDLKNKTQSENSSSSLSKNNFISFDINDFLEDTSEVDSPVFTKSDQRVSSIVVGTFGIFILIGVLAFLMLLDFSTIRRDFAMLKRNLNCESAGADSDDDDNDKQQQRPHNNYNSQTNFKTWRDENSCV